MAFTYWGIDGLGVRLGDIKEMLDAEKIRLAMQKQIDNVLCEKDEVFEDYLNAGNEDRLEYLDEDYCRITDEICGVIAAADDRNLLGTANDGEEGYYLFYPPRYPWDRRENECETEDEARQHICNHLLRFTLPEVTAEQVLEKIDFINEVGSSN